MNNRLSNRSPWRRAAGVAVVLLAALLPACGEDNASGLPPVQRAVIIVTVDPNPVIGTQDEFTGSVSAAYVVNIREVAGLGGEVQFINSTVLDPLTGLQVTSNYIDSDALVVYVGTNRVEPSGELDVSRTLGYSLTDRRVEADLSVAVQFRDDRGTTLNQTLLVPVIPTPVE